MAPKRIPIANLAYFEDLVWNWKRIESGQYRT